jgi:cell division septation protein DedD
MSDTKIRGIPRPNFVVVFDNEKRFEFRVQCEVPLSNEEQAMELLGLLRGRAQDGFTRAKATVQNVIEEYNKSAPNEKKISALSKEIIEKAFNDAIQ